ncbi:MAG: hypothetical protein H0A75_02380 [Candidatus Methanofishera endochildressiae]|uniref:Uncharacterized protein n=1 Tax=Candidatus Methanofishera endochildressiae TaxID=2738884 RepID=A0A7Z0MMY0_9GAMM|nr:hypothetical protein [Candidatus Methanofishera endochildressiae]
MKNLPKRVSIGDPGPKPNAAGKPKLHKIWVKAHQGDQDGKKGVYHINAVDEVTQYEVVLSCRRLNDWTAFPGKTFFFSTYAGADSDPQNNGLTPSGDYQPSRSLSMAGCG